jgi:hypothetical protein
MAAANTIWSVDWARPTRRTDSAAEDAPVQHQKRRAQHDKQCVGDQQKDLLLPERHVQCRVHDPLTNSARLQKALEQICRLERSPIANP